jgi:hypothetical protein
MQMVWSETESSLSLVAADQISCRLLLRRSRIFLVPSYERTGYGFLFLPTLLVRSQLPHPSIRIVYISKLLLKVSPWFKWFYDFLTHPMHQLT